MKTLVVLTFDIPGPEAVPDVLTAINPPQLPHFAGQARIVVEPHATALTTWLDGEH